MTKSNKFAVIKVNNVQYKVHEGETVEMDKMNDVKDGQKLKFDDVLLIVDGEKTQVGKPTLDKAFVEAEVLTQALGEKVKTLVYKGKARFRRRSGNRVKLTKVKITKIS